MNTYIVWVLTCIDGKENNSTHLTTATNIREAKIKVLEDSVYDTTDATFDFSTFSATEENETIVHCITEATEVEAKDVETLVHYLEYYGVN